MRNYPRCIVYSSVTGNTRKIASFLAQNLNIPLFPIAEAPDPQDFPCLILGFWVVRGMPDPPMLRYMHTVREKQIFFFCTHAAWPDSAHIAHLRTSVTQLLEANHNELLGSFTCQGRVHFTASNGHHPMTAERKRRLEEAARHPSSEDCEKALNVLSMALKESCA